MRQIRRKRPLRDMASQVSATAGSVRALTNHVDYLLSSAIKERQTLIHISPFGHRMVTIEIPHPPYDDEDLEHVDLDEALTAAKQRLIALGIQLIKGYRAYRGKQLSAIVERLGAIPFEPLAGKLQQHASEKQWAAAIGDVIRALAAAAGDGSGQPTELQQLITRLANLLPS